jgi:hypothetical protein
LRLARKLGTLNLSNNKLREAGVVALAAGLSGNTSITVLNISGNAINREGAAAFANALRENKHIESVNVSNNFFSDNMPQVMLALCQRNVPARMVDLSRNRVTGDICKRMSEILEGFKFSIACLSVEGNPIGEVGLIALFHAVRGTSLQFFDLSNTGLTAHSGVVLADLIRACPLLNSLQIDNNLLGDGAIVEIATAFVESSSMAALNLENTGLGSVGCAALSSAIAKHKKLRSLIVAENSALSEKDVLGLLDAIATVHTAEYLDLSDLRLVDSEDLLRAMIGAFASNEHLQAITLHYNPISLGFPESTMTREFALSLADTSSLEQFQSKSGGYATISLSDSANQKMELVRYGDTAAATMSPGNTGWKTNTTSFTFRSAWATTRPMEHKSALSTRSDLDDTAEDGRAPPLVPNPHSLHHKLYPGYGYLGRFNNATHISTLSNPVPYSTENSRGLPPPFYLSADGRNLTLQAPRRAPKRSPYSLLELESNIGGLPVTEDQLKRKFKELDVDGNGFLLRHEFRAAFLAYQSFGLPFTEREVDDLMGKFGSGDPQHIYFDEFSILMLKLAQR